MRSELDPDSVCDTLGKLSLIFRFLDFSTKDLSRAAMLYWNDFEDAIQSVTAKRIHADYIITRNISDFELSDVPAVTPRDFLVLLNQDN